MGASHDCMGPLHRQITVNQRVNKILDFLQQNRSTDFLSDLWVQVTTQQTYYRSDNCIKVFWKKVQKEGKISLYTHDVILYITKLYKSVQTVQRSEFKFSN